MPTKIAKNSHNVSLPPVTVVLGWSLWMVSLLIVAIIIYLPWPTIKTINCTIDTVQCPQEIVQALQQTILDQNSLTLNQSQISQFLSKVHPEYIVVGLELTPTTLTIVLAQSTPFARISYSPDSGIVIDKRGFVLGEFNQFSSVQSTISITSPIQYDSTTTHITHQPTLKALEISQHLVDRNSVPKSIQITPNDQIIVTLIDGRKAIFSSMVDISRQVTTLQLILNATTIDTSLPIIDVRFDKPVLKSSVQLE